MVRVKSLGNDGIRYDTVDAEVDEGHHHEGVQTRDRIVEHDGERSPPHAALLPELVEPRLDCLDPESLLPVEETEEGEGDDECRDVRPEPAHVERVDEPCRDEDPMPFVDHEDAMVEVSRRTVVSRTLPAAALIPQILQPGGSWNHGNSDKEAYNDHVEHGEIAPLPTDGEHNDRRERPARAAPPVLGARLHHAREGQDVSQVSEKIARTEARGDQIAGELQGPPSVCVLT